MYHGQRNEASAEALVSPAAAQRLLSLSAPDLRAYLALCQLSDENGIAAEAVAIVVGLSENRTARRLRSLTQQGLAIAIRVEGRGRPILYLAGDPESLFAGQRLPGKDCRAKTAGQTAPGSRAPDRMESPARPPAHASPNPVAPENLDSRSLNLSARVREEKIEAVEEAAADTAAPGVEMPKGLDAVPEVRESRMADHVLRRLKEIRRCVTGRSRLTLPEVRAIRDLLASGATLADFEEAVEDWQSRRKTGKAPELRSLAYLIPVAEEIAAGNREFAEDRKPTTTEANDAGTNGRRDSRSTNGVAQATRPAGGARVTNGRRPAPERRYSPISEEQARDRQRQTDEALRRHLRPMAGG